MLKVANFPDWKVHKVCRGDLRNLKLCRGYLPTHCKLSTLGIADAFRGGALNDAAFHVQKFIDLHHGVVPVLLLVLTY